ncbi:hypothetical protein X801_04282 [Opisthorchis viverrini]|uniref:Uncharacterized protein n=1 Tax=Opisthorchis viverrini TaxID=6198 RepID=A0A1S8WZZ6_OPIVI|nr:hypothetical protein X801_04282 [Opisthorchis viverrini]
MNWSTHRRTSLKALPPWNQENCESSCASTHRDRKRKKNPRLPSTDTRLDCSSNGSRPSGNPPQRWTTLKLLTVPQHNSFIEKTGATWVRSFFTAILCQPSFMLSCTHIFISWFCIQSQYRHVKTRFTAFFFFSFMLYLRPS